jgi:acyl-CoA synthetase (AMP-forming)/AMP-acid ligase II
MSSLKSTSQTWLNPTTLVDILQWRAINQPNSTAYTFVTFVGDGECEQQKISYEELNRKATAIAAALRSASETRGESPNVLVLLPPGLEFIAAFLGCLYAAKAAVPIYPPRPNRTLSRLQSIVDNSQATMALTTDRILSTLGRHFALTPQLKRLNLLATDALNSCAERRWQPPAIDRDSVAFLQYTSGSTATPKGVMVTHNNLFHNLVQQHIVSESLNSHFVSWLPPYHDMGLIGNILLPLFCGAAATLMSPVDFLMRPFRWLQTISRVRGTISGGPNFAYELCLQKVKPAQYRTLDLSSWEMAFTGAEPVRRETLDRFGATFKVCGFRPRAFYPAYGLAEATLFVTGGKRGLGPIIRRVSTAALEHNRSVPAREGLEEARSLVGCGRALPEHSVIIVEPESATRCAAGHVGEIWVSGPSVARGYWQRDEETERVFRAYLSDTGEGPFLRTGDLGFISGEELYVTGRIKDLIIIAGRNLYPQDLEFTVEHSHPSLRQGCGVAFSVDINDTEQLVIVQEVKRQYRYHDQAEIVAAIRRAISEEYQVQIHTVALVNPGAVPKTSSGKLRRRECRTRFLAKELDFCGAREGRKHLSLIPGEKAEELLRA